MIVVSAKDLTKAYGTDVIQIGEVQLTGMCLATIVGIVMGLLMFIIDKCGWANDAE